MRVITTDTISGRVRVPVYSYFEIPYTQIMMSAQESKTRRGISYLEIPCAFDIETTNIYKRITSGKDRGKIDSDFRPYSFMYHWQMCIGCRVIFGRTWDEFQNCLNLIITSMNLSNKFRLVIYVHNLAFEMQHMRKFLRVTDSFCKAERQPLKVVHDDCIEFRCSASLSNMNLKMFCKAENARFYKLSDTYDYTKIRTSETVLTEEEESYCYNDVRGLSECILSLMRFDTLATIPMTSTGYVRRDARKAMKTNKANRRIFTDSALSADEYLSMRAAFRGGNTHAAAHYANQTLRDVRSYDISSSYPTCMMINRYPMSKFIPIKLTTFKKLRKDKGKYCYLLHISLSDIYCTAKHGIPYIALAKTKYCSSDRILDNGRVLKASLVSLWCTDIDMDIIHDDYSYSTLRIESVYCARAEKLPEEYRRVCIDYYQKKTQLKGADDAESIYLYNKSKNRINALYGMMCMRPDQDETTYTGEGSAGYSTIKVVTKKDENILKYILLEDALLNYYKRRNSFLPYQWGVWVTAHARYRLHEFMKLIGDDLVYVDTDSGKILNWQKHSADIDALNERLRAEAEDAGAFADDRNGKRHYMGVFELDGDYDKMKTLGAKKYVVEIKGECYSTIAGVSKQAGQIYFNQHGIDAFRIGACIESSGHLVAYYNDDEIHEIEIEGVTMKTASNLCLIDDTYTIGVTDDYLYLLQAYANKKNILV